MNTSVQSLHIYPVKSCRGQDVSQLILEEMGPIGDRRAMIVDAHGRFLSQRSHGPMARIGAYFENQTIELVLNGEKIKVEWSSDQQTCQVWDDTVRLLIAQSTINVRLSEFLGEPVKLAGMTEETSRRTSGNWADNDVSLSDGYPVLVTNTASLQALSALAGTELSMRQFRPNIVIKDNVPWSEDSWKLIRIGDVEIELVKPCTRCQITTLNPVTGEADFPEVMQAMIAHRRSNDPRIKGVLFGWNGVIRKAGQIKAGDKVVVTEQQDPWPVK